MAGVPISKFIQIASASSSSTAGQLPLGTSIEAINEANKELSTLNVGRLVFNFQRTANPTNELLGGELLRKIGHRIEPMTADDYKISNSMAGYFHSGKDNLDDPFIRIHALDYRRPSEIVGTTLHEVTHAASHLSRMSGPLAAAQDHLNIFQNSISYRRPGFLDEDWMKVGFQQFKTVMSEHGIEEGLAETGRIKLTQRVLPNSIFNSNNPGEYEGRLAYTSLDHFDEYADHYLNNDFIESLKLNLEPGTGIKGPISGKEVILPEERSAYLQSVKSGARKHDAISFNQFIDEIKFSGQVSALARNNGHVRSERYFR